MAFTDDEKARIRHHLGYPSWSQLASSIQLGVPSGSQPLFLLEQSFNRILPDGEERVRFDLCQCEEIERQMGSARSRMKAAQLGNLKLQPGETGMLRTEMTYWTQRLADDLGVVLNPYSSRAYEGMPGGVSAKVIPS